MTKSNVVACLFILTLVCRPARSEVIVIKAGKMLDMNAQRVLMNRIIVVEGERIRTIRSAVGYTPPSGARVIDLSRRTVLPGLIDSHAHLLLNFDARIGGADAEEANAILTVVQMSTAQRALLGAKNAREDLEAGITTVRDLGDSGRNGDVALRDAIDAGWVSGPRMMVSTRALTPIGGEFGRLAEQARGLIEQEYVQISGVEEARRATRQAFYEGATCVKLYSDIGAQMLSLEEIKAIVEEARKPENAGFDKRPVAAHAIGDAAIRNAIDAGVDSIEHAYDASDQTLELLAEKKVFLVLTEGPVHDPLSSLMEKASVETRADKLADARRRIRHAFEYGVSVVAGSDRYYQTPGLTRGQASLLVLKAYSEAGVKPWQILRSATINAAQLLRWPVGLLAPGRYADIIAVDGDPSTNLGALDRVTFVMKGGRVFRDK